MKEAFFTFPWEGSELRGIRARTSRRAEIPPDYYKEHWNVVREVDTAMGVKYDCK